MQVEAIYHDGKIELVSPLKLLRNNVRVMVTVPDDALNIDAPTAPSQPDEVTAAADALRHRLDAIRNATLPSDDQLPQETAKTQDRVNAFATREDR